MIHFDRKTALEILEQSTAKLTAKAYIKKIAAHFSLSIREAKKQVHQLIDAQELCYHDMYGSTYIEKNFLRPVQVTSRYILKPPGFEVKKGKGIEIVLGQGISFGSGQHPTTRLCLEALTDLIFGKQHFYLPSKALCADIGTGSGVLAIAMVLSGLSSCTAFEIDPVSVNEAVNNIKENDLSEKIEVKGDYFKVIPGHYTLICANLRYPTLDTLSRDIRKSLTRNGAVVLSGIRVWEKDQLIETFQNQDLSPVWQKDVKDWSGLALVKAG